MNTEVIEKPSTELTVTARAAVASKALEAPAEPIIESDPIFNQEDGGELLDSLTHVDAAAPTFGDADVIACAATAVSQRFDISFNDALNRMAEIHELVAVELAD